MNREVDLFTDKMYFVKMQSIYCVIKSPERNRRAHKITFPYKFKQIRRSSAVKEYKLLNKFV